MDQTQHQNLIKELLDFIDDESMVSELVKDLDKAEELRDSIELSEDVSAAAAQLHKAVKTLRLEIMQVLAVLKAQLARLRLTRRDEVEAAVRKYKSTAAATELTMRQINRLLRNHGRQGGERRSAEEMDKVAHLMGKVKQGLYDQKIQALQSSISTLERLVREFRIRKLRVLFHSRAPWIFWTLCVLGFGSAVVGEFIEGVYAKLLVAPLVAWGIGLLVEYVLKKRDAAGQRQQLIALALQYENALFWARINEAFGRKALQPTEDR